MVFVIWLADATQQRFHLRKKEKKKNTIHAIGNRSDFQRTCFWLCRTSRPQHKNSFMFVIKLLCGSVQAYPALVKARKHLLLKYDVFFHILVICIFRNSPLWPLSFCTFWKLDLHFCNILHFSWCRCCTYLHFWNAVFSGGLNSRVQQ